MGRGGGGGLLLRACVTVAFSTRRKQREKRAVLEEGLMGNRKQLGQDYGKAPQADCIQDVARDYGVVRRQQGNPR
jgi:hypothetical protein